MCLIEAGTRLNGKSQQGSDKREMSANSIERSVEQWWNGTTGLGKRILDGELNRSLGNELYFLPSEARFCVCLNLVFYIIQISDDMTTSSKTSLTLGTLKFYLHKFPSISDSSTNSRFLCYDLSFVNKTERKYL